MTRGIRRPTATTLWRVSLAMTMLVGWVVVLLALLAITGLFVVALADSRSPNGPLLLIAGIAFVAVACAIVDLVGTNSGQPAVGVRVIRGKSGQEIWRLVDWISEQIGYRSLREVVIVAEPNAWVTESTRLLGLVPGRRVLYLGAPLTYGLAEPELTAVLCHEFAHYAHGDSRFTALMYRGSQAINATELRIAWLRRKNAQIAMALYIPYRFSRWYDSLYHRVAFPALRRHELAADSLAADATGVLTFSYALRSVGAIGLAWNAFIVDQSAARTPPGLTASTLREFAELLADPAYQITFQRYLRQAEFSVERADDTHPSIARRLAALASRDDDRLASASSTAAPTGLRREIADLLAGREKKGHSGLLGDYAAGQRKWPGHLRLTLAAAIAGIVAIVLAGHGYRSANPPTDVTPAFTPPAVYPSEQATPHVCPPGTPPGTPGCLVVSPMPTIRISLRPGGLVPSAIASALP